MTAEQRVLAWLERADFNGRGCWHSQDTIARATGCCRRTVIRSVASLEADGRIRVQRFARGSRRPNVYRVTHWNPHKRAGVLNVLAAIREARASECHSKRTATASRAQTPPSAPFPRCTQLENKRCGREARIEKPEIGRRRTSMQAHGGQRRFAVPSLTCLTCQELAEELDRARNLLRSQAVETSKVVEELSDAHSALGAAGKEIRTLKGRLTREANESAKADQIEAVADHWRKHRPKSHPAFGKAGSKSYGIIEKALGLMAEDEAGPVAACCEAIDGLHMAPWQRYDKRYTRKVDDKTMLRNSVEHALGDESRIERCRGIVRWAQADGADRAFEVWQVQQQVEQAWMRAWYEEVRHRQDPPEPPFDSIVFTVDGIVTRSDG